MGRGTRGVLFGGLQKETWVVAPPSWDDDDLICRKADGAEDAPTLVKFVFGYI